MATLYFYERHLNHFYYILTFLGDNLLFQLILMLFCSKKEPMNYYWASLSIIIISKIEIFVTQKRPGCFLMASIFLIFRKQMSCDAFYIVPGSISFVIGFFTFIMYKTGIFSRFFRKVSWETIFTIMFWPLISYTKNEYTIYTHMLEYVVYLFIPLWWKVTTQIYF